MDMQEVDAMTLEPFELHATEHFSDHSPSEFLSTKFYLPNGNSMKHIDEKEEVDVELWTKAVDNMFKSSPLFNSDLREEEKENVDENLLDNASKESCIGDFHLDEEDQALKDDEKFIQECALNRICEGEISCETKSSKTLHVHGDQIVPIARGFAPQTTPTKRRFSDLDVNFAALPAFNAKPDLKKFKLNPETGKEVIEEQGTVGDYDPPKNSIFIDYSFDPKARLPSFREAFVPALKRISRREKELRRKLRNSVGVKEIGYPLADIKTTCSTIPAEGQNKSGDQPSSGDTGASLDRGHPNDILSELNQVNHLETMDQNGSNLSPQDTIEHSRITEVSHFGEKLSNSDLKIDIKQEEFVDCDRHLENQINGSPAKILGITSANLKDIERNIFNFDEGLDMLDLEPEFQLQSITTSHAEALNTIHSQGEADWSVKLSHVSDVHQTYRHNALGQSDTEASNFISNQNIPDASKANEQYLTVNRNTAISSFGGSFAVTPVTSYSMPLHHTNSAANLPQFENHHERGIDAAKFGNSMKRFDLLGQAENHQQQELNVLHINGYDIVNGDKHLADISVAHNHLNQFPHDVNMMKQPVAGIEGQMIARQIHQSFGADVFGAPGDDGAKILAKYLAQRGSTRPDNEEQRGSMTSAISSLISKSFSQQEANQRMQRENNTLDFLHAADFENLDIINENF